MAGRAVEFLPMWNPAVQRYGTPQRGAPFAGIFSVIVGAGFVIVGIGVTESPVPQLVGAFAIGLGLVLLSLRRGTVIDPVARKVTRRSGWWFRPHDDEYDFGAFSAVALARTAGTTPIFAVKLVGPPHIYLPAGGRGFKKDAARRAREIEKLMELELCEAMHEVRPLELF